jgi:hypothetical protein
LPALASTPEEINDTRYHQDVERYADYWILNREVKQDSEKLKDQPQDRSRGAIAVTATPSTTIRLPTADSGEDVDGDKNN